MYINESAIDGRSLNTPNSVMEFHRLSYEAAFIALYIKGCIAGNFTHMITIYMVDIAPAKV